MALQLKNIDYKQHEGTDREWSVQGLSFRNINLHVGKNATGKTRTLNIISSLSKILLGHVQTPIGHCDYVVTFDGDDKYIYELIVNDGSVTHERLLVNNDVRLTRDANELKIWAEELGTEVRYEPQHNEIAAVARRDKLQHPFLIPLADWADKVRHFSFGSSLGRDHVLVNIEGAPRLDDRNDHAVVATMSKGVDEFGNDYKTAVLSDMKLVGFELSDFEITHHDNMRIKANEAFQKPRVVAISEAGVDGRVFQDEVSQGMFRALSVLAQIHYSQMSGQAACILIDDVGEGLDFERSSNLIDVLRRLATHHAFQLIMSTNDQFVMNHIPLDEWTVLRREGHNVAVYNSVNSAEKFEEFRFVGMSNFTFFEMDFLGEQKEAVAHE